MKPFNAQEARRLTASTLSEDFKRKSSFVFGQIHEAALNKEYSVDFLKDFYADFYWEYITSREFIDTMKALGYAIAIHPSRSFSFQNYTFSSSLDSETLSIYW